jgi:diguanylate cyclase (GGDEF)-like protein/PAS domain S-box-containing protein
VIREPQFRNRQRRKAVRILLLEDDPIFAELVEAQLRRMPGVDSRLEAVGTLQEARARLAAAPLEFDLVVTDLNLPDSSGPATVEALARAGDQPIIVLTGDATPDLRAAVIEAGAYDFLQKGRLSAAALERMVRIAALQASAFHALRDSETRFGSLLELSSDWYWEQDEELRFTRFEGRVKTAMGDLPSLAMGKRRWEMPVTPLSSSWDEHKTLLAARQPFRDFEYSRLGGDGELRYVSVNGVPVFDADGGFRGYRGIATEITGRKQAEEAQRRFRLALDTSPDMILLVDAESMRHLDVNATICALLGYSREELLAMGPHDILPVSRGELAELYRRMIADPSKVTGMRSHYRCKDGTQLPFESTRRVLKSGGRWIIAIISRDIRERLAAEKALADGEARFRSLTALSSDWYWEQDEQFRLTFMSTIEKLGLDPANYLGRRRWDQPALNLSDDDWARHRAQLERHEPFRDFEIERPSADGRSVWITLSGEPVFDAAGRFTGYRGTGRDITRRKLNERKITELGRMNAALGAANEAVLRARSPQEVFERACDVAVAAGGFQLVTVFGLDAANNQLARLAASGEAAPHVKDVLPPIDQSEPGGGGLLGMAVRTRQAAIANDYATDRRTVGRRIQIQSYRVGSAAAFPLAVGGNVLGVLGVQHAQRGAFTEELNGLLQHLADNISFALENFQREEGRLQDRRGLRESEERFRSLTQLSSDIYWEQDEQYRFTRVSGAGSPLQESVRTQMVGKRRWERHYFNMTEAMWAAHRADLDARRAFRDLELGRVDAGGRTVWVNVSGEPMYDEAGAFRGYHGVGKDITERKRAARLRELEHTVTKSLAEADSVEEAIRRTIRAVCETEGWDCGRYFSPDSRAGVLRLTGAWGVEDEKVQRFLAGSRNLRFQFGNGIAGRVWESAQPLWVVDILVDRRALQSGLARACGIRGAFMFPVVAEGKAIGVLGFNSRKLRQADEALIQAIGAIGSQIGQFLQRKQAEEVLRDSEARFRALTSLSSDWYWEQDAELRFTKFEGRGEGNYAPAAAVLGKRFWELEGLVRESFDLAAHRGRLERHEAFRALEYEYRDRSGRRFYVSADGEPLFDQAGAFAGYRGTSRDVTRQRRDEESLRRFRAALDASPDSVVLVDARTGRYLDFNETACRVLGYSREELLGMHTSEVRVDRAGGELLGDYRRLAADADTTADRTADVGVCRRKDGSTFPAEFTRRILQTDSGPVIVAHVRDISERVRAEERKAAHLRYQERIARFGQAALMQREPFELIDNTVQEVLEALDPEAVAYLEAEPNASELVVRALVGVAELAGFPGTVACPPGSPVLEAMRWGKPKLVPGAELPLGWKKPPHSVALVPVRGEHGVRALLCVWAKDAVAFSAEELNFAEAAASVVSAALRRIESESRLAYLAQFDPLTGLPNRTLLADRFAQMIVQARRRNGPLAVLFIDLDGFKTVNDTLGHAGGDDLLREVAVRLQSSVRSGDTVARISGDEFAIVLADLARTEDAAIVAQKVIDRVGATVDIAGKEVFVTASVGIATFPADGADAETLIGAADAAMYRAKESGRNAYQFYTAEINQRSRARAQLGTELRRALEREEFVLFYQPKVDLTTRAVNGAEALLRWKHPERGMVSPGEFIPVLEETGLIVPVGDWVLRRACKDLKAWQESGLAVVPIAVNLSARQFRDAELDKHIKALVAAEGIDPKLIELEITESQLMHDPQHGIRVMHALCEAGMRIAIDDFGTGYSSLAYLRRFPVGALKIDRSFVKDMSSEKGDATIVRTIIEMAHSLGFTVVAEGVETEEQATFLRLLRCQLAQGFLFAKPMPAAELVKLLATR